ncbi:MAG: membrane-associated Zn-dependent protease [Candidatus Woesearchaeota archaeon]|nr:MAG: membrane-associated Zn-dependent protease [Candidatus Woesearchaeota archaeon]
MEIFRSISEYVDISVLLFYVIIALIIFITRKKWQVESKFIFLLRTKWGINVIDKFTDKNKELVKIIGYSAIGVGFLGMLLIIGFLLRGVYELFFVPNAPPVMSLVIPGVKIPGSPIFLPFWYGILALFVVIVFHEFGHGVVAKAHGIPIKSTGIAFFGPLPGAFVEPDEKKVTKASSPVQVSIFASGPFFNAILSGITILILLLILNPILSSMIVPSGVKFSSIQEGYPAAAAGLEKDVIYTHINGKPIEDKTTFTNIISCSAPGDNITLQNENKSITITLTENPNNKEKGYMGVSGITTEYTLKDKKLKTPYQIVYMLTTLLEWIFMLSLGIGLANLLPLGPVDGGRMLHTALIDVKGKEKRITIMVKNKLDYISSINTSFVCSNN